MRIILAVPFMTYAVSAFTVAPAPSARPVMTQLHLYDSVEAAIAEAQRICAEDPSSPECRVAWDIVEELEAADSHKQAGQQINTAQSMDYVALFGSFDILAQKIDGKMDQLMATTEKMGALGADQSITDLGRIAAEMKEALANARATLSQY